VPLLWVFSLLLLVTVLLTSSALFLLARSGSIHIVIAPFTSSNANSSSNSSSSSGGAATTSTGTNQTQGGGQGTGTATHAASGTATSSLLGTPTSSAARATSTPTPPFLSVSPTTFSKLLCPTSVQFTITNTGQAQLAWSASAPSGYTISPQSGIVNGGDDVVVKVSTGLLGGTVTITASGAVNSPQQVTISCL
jgi:hypothetical protein